MVSYSPVPVADETHNGFKMFPAIVMMVIFLSFFGAMLYVLVSSF